MNVLEQRVIQSPDEFWRFVAELKDAVKAMVLVQTNPPSSKYRYESTSLSDITEDAILPDQIDMFFLERGTKNTYHLAVELYHGRGGDWKRCS